MDETSAPELAKLRRILVGEERARLDQLEAKVEDNTLSPENLAARLPEAILMRAAQDRQLARALAPTVEGAISESVRRKPGEFADAIFPVLGPAIRKAIAETMAELVGSINRAMQHSFSARGLSWRFESWRTGVPYASVVIKHALVYRVEQVFLVHRETGLLLAQAHPPNLAVPDADLVSGMLTAIRDFVGDSFSGEKEVGGLRTFSVGELTVMVEQGPKAVLAAVVRGQAPESYLRRLQETVEAVHGQFPSALSEFEGDTAPFEPVQPLLEDCLVTVLETDQPAGAKVNWTPWALGLGVVAVALIAWWIWSVVEFNRVVRALRAAPGIVVVEATRGWRTHEVRGLRDPSGADPAVVINGAGMNQARVVQQWEPYVSLTPSLVVSRALRVLGQPAPGAATPTSWGSAPSGGTAPAPSAAVARSAAPSFAMRGETLLVKGPVDATWLARAAHRTGWPAGVAGVELRDATPTLPASLAAAGDSLVTGRVLFAPGSSDLDDAAVGAVRGAARQVRAIAGGLAPQGVTVGLTMTGRTDATGTDSSNQSLSRDRADRVRRAIDAALKGSGLTVGFEAQGVGTLQPLTAGDSAARATLNRSVSFGIHLSIDAAPGARPQ